MNEEQKKRATELLAAWRATAYALHGDAMADLLQEMVEAPEPEPVAWNVEGKDGETMCVTDNKFAADRYIACGYVVAPLYTAPPAPSVPETEPVARVTGYYGGYLSIVTVDGQVLSTGTALYAAPPHQSEHHLEMVNTPAPSVPDGHVYVYVSGLTGSGKSAVAGEIEIALRASGLDVEWVDSESEKHLTHADYTSALELYRPKVRIFEKNIPRTAQPAPSVPVKPMENIALNEWLDKTEWVQKELNTFPVSSLGMHRADVMRLEIDRLRKLLSAAPTPAEPPADVARDAERYRWLRDKCRATGEHWGGRWSLVIEGPCPDGDESSGAIDKAIDAAIERQGGES